MHVTLLVSEDHLTGVGPLVLAAEGQLVFIARGAAHLQRAGHVGQIEHRDGNGIRHRHRIAQVHQRVQRRQVALLAAAESAARRNGLAAADFSPVSVQT